MNRRSGPNDEPRGRRESESNTNRPRRARPARADEARAAPREDETSRLPREAPRAAPEEVPFGSGLEHPPASSGSRERPRHPEDEPHPGGKRKRRSGTPPVGHGRQAEPARRQSRLAQLIANAPPPIPSPPRPAGLTPRVWRGLTLSDFQVQALDAVAAGKNVLVGAPTGAGKTLVAEYAIEDAILRKRRCIYTSPIKALSNQKYRDFRDDPRVEVGLMTGDVTLNPSAQVLIMTTEILRNAILENPRQLSDVEYVVFDEVHFLDDAERGTVWEESLIFAPASVRFICLSATVANIHELGKWIREIRSQPLEVIESHWRPVPLTHRLWNPRTGVFDLSDIPAMRRKALAFGSEAAHGARRGRPDRRGRDQGRPPRALQPDPDRLLDELEQVGALPALVFSFSRKDCERHARRNGGRELLTREDRERMAKLQAELVLLFRLPETTLDGEIMSLARRGIGYHHAGMLPIDKELVERMFTSGLLKLLFTTETFALGINMPARSVVFNSLRKFDGVSVDWLRTREYMQMAGRAGRQGIDREGLVFSVLDDTALTEAPLERILSGTPESVMSRFKLSYSTILHLLVSLGRERLFEAWEKSFHHFQHRAGTEKAQLKLRAQQRALLEAHLEFLAENNYIDKQDQLTPKGKVARVLNGYEIQLTELLFRGALENLPPRAVAMIFAALVYEERRRGGGPYLPHKMFGALRKQVDLILRSLVQSELRVGIPEPMKVADWGLSPAVLAWCEGATMEDLADLTEVLPGDVVRTLRMALQFVRQVRRAIDPSWDLVETLDNALAMVNRDEMDARAQLQLG
ncbi:MAG TPA: DEAD/DEAH box helicase [Planctomycetota bacterium]|nr:DEAD/DEAH box helicase [Planctomycetota bacterium]